MFELNAFSIGIQQSYSFKKKAPELDYTSFFSRGVDALFPFSPAAVFKK